MDDMELGIDLPETASRGPRFAWDGLVMLGLGVVIAIMGVVLGLKTSFDRIESEPVPTPADLAAAQARGAELMQWGLLVGAIVGAIGLALIVLSAVCPPRTPTPTA